MNRCIHMATPTMTSPSHPRKPSHSTAAPSARDITPPMHRALVVLSIFACGCAPRGETHTTCTDRLPEGESSSTRRDSEYAAGPLANLGWLQGAWSRREDG